MLILLVSLLLSGLTIDSVEIRGTDAIPASEIRSDFRSLMNRETSEKEIEGQIRQTLHRYVDQGYPFVVIDYEITTDNGKNKLVLTVEEGKRLRFGEIKVTGDSEIIDREIRAIEKLRGKRFDKKRLMEQIDSIRNEYSEAGFPLVVVGLRNFKLSEDRSAIGFEMDIDKGERIRISDVKVSGLSKTKPAVVIRELPVKPGMIYRQSVIDDSLRILRNMRFIYDVDPKVMERGNDPAELRFNASVTEARTGIIEGVLGYVPAQVEGERAKLTGSITAREESILGTGRSVNFVWRSGESREVYIQYIEPWVAGHPVDLKLNYAGETPGVRSYGLFLSGRLGARVTGEIGLSYERAKLPAETMNAGTLGVSSRYDSRDSAINPRSGETFEVAIGQSFGDYRLTTLKVGVSEYLNPFRNQVLALAAHFATIPNDTIPEFRLLSLGGATTLRGYGEDWFRGRSTVYANVEYRLLNSPKSHFFAFFDLGSHAPENGAVLEFRPVEIGYGVGARLEAKAGRMNIYYGLTRGDSLLNGKIHVSLGTAF